ncbi:thiol:disulfide interchange protein DsbA/DsbL [Caenimonas aquaedulcis]|uniref:Thiol:disulfide interchange protein n=1 Tax=Caenimonas aquaedulcis TaxID=2793270 RepID=A0A931H6F7_9BURK|nr:thiol:disulfide interchange protein DsbA/DsbL [Caenimonas aquaedulcis]MBG9389265.1 thiol:disulfide interchange protein DsbA/DsbL [Caenimonas aquaedulcis]
MNRREFSQGAACMAAAMALGLPGAVFGQARRPDDGSEYLTLAKRVNVDAPPGKIEVVDFFWYNCPHCNAFEPSLVAWMKKLPDDVVVKRVPVAFREEMVFQQRLYYTLEAMNRLDLHGKVFNSIHTEHVPVHQPAFILEWAGKQGLDKARFQEIYGSFGVTGKVRRAIELADAYKVAAVPALGVAGRYYTDGDLAQNMDRALQVVDYLIAESRKAR